MIRIDILVLAVRVCSDMGGDARVGWCVQGYEREGLCIRKEEGELACR